MVYIDKQPLMEDNVKKYLDKVVDRMVSETEVLGTEYDKERVFIMTPFYDGVFTEDGFIEMKRELQTLKYFPINKLTHNFSSHVENIYGLSKEEVRYTIKKYIDTILLKINGGY